MVASGNRNGSPDRFAPARLALAFIGSALVQNDGPPTNPNEQPVC